MWRIRVFLDWEEPEEEEEAEPEMEETPGLVLAPDSSKVAFEADGICKTIMRCF